MPSLLSTSSLPTSSVPPFSEPNIQLHLGTDLVFVPRIARLDARYGAAFFLKLLTPTEWAYCDSSMQPSRPSSARSRQRLQRIAGRIATKEAVAKALGCGLNGLGWGKGIAWRDIEVISMEKQAPALTLHGQAAHHATTAGITLWRLSLSHDGDYAMATAVAGRKIWLLRE